MSPFDPDQNHLHHRLMMRYGSHQKTAIAVYVYTIAFILLAFSRPFLFPNLGEEGMFFGLLLLSFLWFLPLLMSTRNAHKNNIKRQEELSQKASKSRGLKKSMTSSESVFARS
jgi:hypothetical protein